jgi:hypothetical protein
MLNLVPNFCVLYDEISLADITKLGRFTLHVQFCPEHGYTLVGPYMQVTLSGSFRALEYPPPPRLTSSLDGLRRSSFFSVLLTPVLSDQLETLVFQTTSEIRKVLFSGIQRRAVRLNLTDVSEEHILILESNYKPCKKPRWGSSLPQPREPIRTDILSVVRNHGGAVHYHSRENLSKLTS